MKKNIFLFLLLIGIVLRFFLQFFMPVFNVDEISLGNNIKHSDFIELLYPLQYGQSSPPLFLWLEKISIIISPFSFWVNIKIISFVSSTLGIVLFYNFAKKYDFKILFVLLFIIFVFNPFNINNSLTVKQYTIDLTGIMFLLNYFRQKWFKSFNFIFFMLWCLMSNIGLFACGGFLLCNFFKENRKISLFVFYDFVNKYKLTFFAPIPYLVYFFWFMDQKGAAELKIYMTNYWSSSFIPLNNNIWHYLLYTFHGLWVFIFNSFEVFGLFLMLMTIPFFVFWRKKDMLFKEEISLLLWILSIHLVLNIFQLYPFSDRLYLYLSPLLLLILGSSLDFLSKLEYVKKYFFGTICLISTLAFFLYSMYLPSSDNDIVSLNCKLDKLNVKSVYITKKSKDCIESFNHFTDNKFSYDGDLILLDKTLDESNFIVSRVAKKIKMNITSAEEKEIQYLIDNNKILKIDKVNGYNIYKVKNIRW